MAEKNAFEHPISARHKMMETLTVFEDVFVPQERVFLAGEWQFAGPLALTFVEFHRFTAVSYKLPLVDALVGRPPAGGVQRGGQGGPRAGQAGLADRVRRGAGASTETAARRCRVHPPGIAPGPLTVNTAKLHFATNYHQAVARLQDIAGAPGDLPGGGGCAPPSWAPGTALPGGQAGGGRRGPPAGPQPGGPTSPPQTSGATRRSSPSTPRARSRPRS